MNKGSVVAASCERVHVIAGDTCKAIATFQGRRFGL
jgi:hypothetical protein